MVCIRKTFIFISCGFLLCVGLSAIAQAEHAPSPSDNMKSDSISDRQQFQSDDDKQKHVELESSSAEGARTIKGELFRVEKGNYFVKGKDGKEVRLHTDNTTKMIGEIMKGDRIEAEVNSENHALSIRSAP